MLDFSDLRTCSYFPVAPPLDPRICLMASDATRGAAHFQPHTQCCKHGGCEQSCHHMGPAANCNFGHWLQHMGWAVWLWQKFAEGGGVAGFKPWGEGHHQWSSARWHTRARLMAIVMNLGPHAAPSIAEKLSQWLYLASHPMSPHRSHDYVQGNYVMVPVTHIATKGLSKSAEDAVPACACIILAFLSHEHDITALKA